MDLSGFFADGISGWAAFYAGLASFLTPCVLPLIPAWLTLVTGLSYDELTDQGGCREKAGRMFWPTLFFVLGFGLVFCLLGAAAGLAGGFLERHGFWLRYPAGLIIIFFGLYLAGIISPSFLQREKRLELHRRPLGLVGAFVVGLGFAAGWTPCVGPVLGTILVLAAGEQSALRGVGLLALYSLGLGLPFLALSLAWERIWPLLTRIRPVVRWSGRVLGFLMIALGLLVISGRLSLGLA